MIRDTSAQDIVRTTSTTSPRKWLLIGLCGLAMLGVLSMGISKIGLWFKGEITVSAETIRTAQVERGDFISDLGLEGRVVAAVSPTLYSPLAGIVNLKVQPGDNVSKNQIVAIVDSPESQAELEQQQANLQRLQAQLGRQRIQSKITQAGNQQILDLAQVKLRAAHREMRRAEKSKNISAISDIEYERYKDELSRAEVEAKHAQQDASLNKESLEYELRTKELELESQQLLVDNLKRRVEDLSLRSPVDGVIGRVEIKHKAAVAANTALITVVDLSAFEVELLIPESYADDLGIGMSAEVLYNSNQYTGKLSSLSAQVVNNQVTGRIRFTDQGPQGLRENQRLQARIIINHLVDVLKIKRGAFIESGAGRIAYVLDNQGLAHRHEIQLGSRSISQVEILTGLDQGQTIITSNITQFQNAQTVRIAD